MQELTKVVQRQDAFYKLYPSSSNETSINLSTEISSLISDESGEVTFTIYKEDLIKAISALCLIPKIYKKKEQEPSKPFEILSTLYQLISIEFGDYATAEYTVNHLKRDDGRAYFNNLKLPNGFNFRSFLVEQFSLIHFMKSDDGKLSMRLETRLPKENIVRIEEKPSYDELDKSLPLQVIYYGAPGTGKSHMVDKTAKEEISVRTTFHPDSDYASFVGAYKPTMQTQRIHYVDTKGQIAYVEQDKTVKDELKHPGTENKIVYKYVPQAFLKAYVSAWKRIVTGDPYFLVIEEINRGNCAQIFGDLFQLLDRNDQGASSYAITADEDITQYLANDSNGFAGFAADEKNAIRDFVLIKDSGEHVALGEDILLGKKLLLPPNLYIWATMNTSDQSLFPIDSAFKRRWNWKYIPIDYTKKQWQLEVGGVRYWWADFLRKINPLIHTLTESADKQMGYFFAKADKKTSDESKENDLISEDIFLNKVLFYLWSDVLKDFDAGQEPFIDSETNTTYNFSDFFDPQKGKTKIAEFVSKLELTTVGNYADEPTDEAAEIVSDRASDNLRLSVIFPDGEKIVGNTKFDAYLQALKRIGFDKVEPIAAEMKYKRKGSPLVSLDQKQAIVDAPDYTYVTIGAYNLIKGMNGKTMRNFLNLVSDRLNLDLQVIYE